MMIITLIALMVVVVIAGMFLNVVLQDRKINASNNRTALKRELRDLNESLRTARVWDKESIIDRILEIERKLA